MSGTTISVVVPTFNRADVLGLTLKRLAQQSLPPAQYELCVVDDGSSDGSEAIVKLQQESFPVTYLPQLNRGPAAARNLGAMQTKSDIVLFVDSDVIAERDLLERHLEAHAESAERLVVGRVRAWPSERRPWYDRVLDPDGAGMDYGAAQREVSFFHALAGNLSLPRTLFDQLGGFDEELWCFEETELAYRASLQDSMLHYQPRAVGYHHHLRSIQQRCGQQRSHMRPLAVVLRKHPELQGIIPGVDALMPFWCEPHSWQAATGRARAAFFGTPISRAAGYAVLSLLDRQRALPRLASIVYWRLMLGWAWVGLREGLRLERKAVTTLKTI